MGSVRRPYLTTQEPPPLDPAGGHYHGPPGARWCPRTARVPRAVWTDHDRPGLFNCCPECERQSPQGWSHQPRPALAALAAAG